MKVFISWSGTVSLEIAQAIHRWLPLVVQQIEPFLSNNLDKGVRWGNEIAKALENAQFGLCCVTADNHSNPWLLFEAGALSKSVESDRAAPVLFAVGKAILKDSPLSQFQFTDFNKTDFSKLLYSINDALGERKITEDQLATSFEKFWPDLESAVNRALNISAPSSRDETDEQDGGGDQAVAVSNAIPNENPNDGLTVLFTKSAEEFEKNIDAFRSTDLYNTNPDYWETAIVGRRPTLGLGDGSETLKTLLDEHPDWIWPRIRLAQEALTLEDFPEAQSLLGEIRKAPTATDSGAEAEFNIRGIDDLSLKLAYAQDGSFGLLSQLKLILAFRDSKRAHNALEESVRLLKKGEKRTPLENRALVFALQYEAIRRNPADNAMKWALAYSMAAVDEFALTAFHHYAQLSEADQYKYSKNNAAILAHSSGKKAYAISLYRSEAEGGNPLASSNLANLMIEDGYLSEADALLSGTIGEDDKENVAQTKARLETARRRVIEEADEFSKQAGEESARFRTFFINAIRAWERDNGLEDGAEWSSNQYGLRVVAAGGAVSVELARDKSLLKGRAQFNGIFYEAALSDSSNSLLSFDTAKIYFAPGLIDGRLSAIILGLSGSKGPVQIYMDVAHRDGDS